MRTLPAISIPLFSSLSFRYFILWYFFDLWSFFYAEEHIYIVRCVSFYTVVSLTFSACAESRPLLLVFWAEHRTSAYGWRNNQGWIPWSKSSLVEEFLARRGRLCRCIFAWESCQHQSLPSTAIDDLYRQNLLSWKQWCMCMSQEPIVASSGNGWLLQSFA